MAAPAMSAKGAMRDMPHACARNGAMSRVVGDAAGVMRELRVGERGERRKAVPLEVERARPFGSFDSPPWGAALAGAGDGLLSRDLSIGVPSAL